MDVLVLLCLAISAQVLVAEASLRRGPPAMYVLGDSLLDVGNNNYLPGPDVFRANRPYYGIDFPGRIPTGRFSNGYSTADYIGACSACVRIYVYSDCCLNVRRVIVYASMQRRAWVWCVAPLLTCRWHPST
jgi:hypothetical protein